jgi:hypothetical protein
MSWFNVGYSEKHLKQMDDVYKRKYGKVKRLSEIKEFDSLPVDDDSDHDDVKTLDENKDEKFDYSDLED